MAIRKLGAELQPILGPESVMSHPNGLADWRAALAAGAARARRRRLLKYAAFALGLAAIGAAGVAGVVLYGMHSVWIF